MLSKMYLKVQMDAKFGQLKMKTLVNVLVHLLMYKRVQTEQQ